MDVQTGTLEPGPFDLAVSQFGVMFFDEPTAALAAIKTRLAPDGRFVFACWQSVERNPWHVGTALRPLLPPPATPPPGKSPVGPFAFGDEEYVRELLEAAGFGSVRVEAHEATVRGPAQAVTDPSLFGLMGVPPEREEEAAARVEAHLARIRHRPGRVRVPARLHGLRRDGVAVGGSSPATAARPWPRSWASPRGRRSRWSAAPAGVIEGLPPGVRVKRQARGRQTSSSPSSPERRVLERRIGALGEMVFPSGGLWLAWPKRASGDGDFGQRGRRPRVGPAARPG